MTGAELRCRYAAGERDFRGADLQCANLLGAYLQGAYLLGANLQCANLQRADLQCADLQRANLQCANLQCANLQRADLQCADLQRANLRGADLQCADLQRANLRGADLQDADLRGAHLQDADLRGTTLDPAAPVPELTDDEIIAAGLEPITHEGIRYVAGWRTAESQHIGLTCYEPGQEYVAPWFSVDTTTACHPGIYIASKAWLQHNYPGVPLVRCFCRRDELIHAGDKWRAKRIRVVATKGKP